MEGAIDTPARDGRGWYSVTILCVLYLFSYIDRSILAVMAPAVCASLHLSDTQMSLILGAGFAIVYATVGIPFAHAMDNGERRIGLIAGVAFWSLSTAACSLATSFLPLLLCRAGVALGEAVLTPAAVSLIADLFPASRRRLPMTVYSTVGAVMGMGGFVGGAAALQLGTHLAGNFGLEPWRLTLVLLGIPGLVLAALMAFTFREPLRRGVSAMPQESGSFSDFWGYIVARRAFFVPLYLAAGIGTLLPLAFMAWSPTLLVRQYGIAQAIASYRIGWVGMVFSIAGTLLWPYLDRILEKKSPGRGSIAALACAAGIAMLAIPILKIDNAAILITGVGLSMSCLGAWSILPALIIQRFAPGRMRARMIAMHLLFISGVGYSLGPLLPVRLTAFAGSNDLRTGLFILAVIAVPAAFACYIVCFRNAHVLSDSS